MSRSNLEALAVDIYEWCEDNNLWGDCIIYFDGKAWSDYFNWNGEDSTHIDHNLYEYDGKNPLDYFEYANPDTLSMSFEGALNYVLNSYCGDWVRLEEEFESLFENHGYYFEMGDSWNLSAYEI